MHLEYMKLLPYFLYKFGKSFSFPIIPLLVYKPSGCLRRASLEVLEGEVCNDREGYWLCGQYPVTVEGASCLARQWGIPYHVVWV